MCVTSLFFEFLQNTLFDFNNFLFIYMCVCVHIYSRRMGEFSVSYLKYLNENKTRI